MKKKSFLQMSRAKAIASALVSDGLHVDAVVRLVLDYSEFKFTLVSAVPTTLFHSTVDELPDGRIVNHTESRKLLIGDEKYLFYLDMSSLVVLENYVALISGERIVGYDSMQKLWLPFALSLDPLLLASGTHSLVSLHAGSRLRVWDVAKRAPVRTIDTFVADGCERTLALSPNGKFAALAIFKPCIYVLNTVTGAHDITLAGHTRTVCALKFINDAKLASTSRDEYLRIWNVATQECLHVLGCQGRRMLSLVVLSCGYIVSSDACGHTNVWNSETGKLLFEKYFGEGCAMCSSHTGGLVVKSHGELRVYE